MLNIQHTARALAPSMASPALVNMIRARGSWEAEHVKAPAGNAQVALQVDPRFYPKSHDQYDLASLNKGGQWQGLLKKQQISSAGLSATALSLASDFADRPPVDRSLNSGTVKVSAHSASKYDTAQVGLVGPTSMQERIGRYQDKKILPDFIHGFFTNENDPKYQAFLKHPEQFPATSFTSAGSMLLMPNVKYIKSHAEAFAEPGKVTQETRDHSGFALVGYWVPPQTFEGRESFQKLFGSQEQPLKGVDERETVAEYNHRTGSPFIVTPLDVRKEHLPMLTAFREMSLKNLQEVYGFEPGKDKVEMYLHFPIYGDATAGLHVHVRVNQGLPAGEADANSIPFDKLLNVLGDDSIPAEAVHQHLLDSSAKTRSGQHISFSAAWGKDQFEGLGVKYVPNPWKRP